MVNRMVSVDTESKAVTYYDKQQNLQTLGEIYTDDFTGEGIRKYSLKANQNNPYVRSKKRDENELFKLGVGSDNLSFVQPSEAQQLILDRGLKIVDQYGTNGGIEMVTIFNNPGCVYPDIYEYDRVAHWQARSMVAGEIFHAIELRTSLVVGKMAAHYREGIYRLVCTNGLVARIMQLPSLSFKHLNWDTAKVAKLIDHNGFSVKGYAEIPQGPEVANKAMLSAAYTALSRYRDSRATGKDDLAIFSANEFYYFSKPKMTAKLLNSYLSHLRDLLDGSSGGSVYSGQIVNAYTSGVNELRFQQPDPLRGAWSGLALTDMVTEATVNLARMAGLFMETMPAYQEIKLGSDDVVSELDELEY